MTDYLSSAEKAQALDKEASAWGLAPFALVEAAGRGCAAKLARALRKLRLDNPLIVILCGKGNNAADALVMLRALVFDAYVDVDSVQVLLTKMPNETDETPLAMALRAVQVLGIPTKLWEKSDADLIRCADIIIDGIAGTGVKEPLKGTAAEMAEALCADKQEALVFSVDVPSGLFDGWQPGMHAVKADITLAIEPQKLCLYAPIVRLLAGQIIPVGGIFPSELMEKYRDAELLSWDTAAALIPPVEETAHKYTRSLVEIHAGSPGAAGAAMLAAQGAQSVGAGLVRLIADPSLYSVLAPGAGGIMVVPGEQDLSVWKDPAIPRFAPNAILLGPGWGRGEDRTHILQNFLPLEKQGLPLILDADAIALAKDIVFNGNVILTPHPGEFADYTNLSKEKVLANPIPVLRQFAAEKNCTILLKGHVLYIVNPQGRTGIIDGMEPILACGGTGDVLAGFCAGIAARMNVSGSFDPYTCTAAAATLLIETARGKEIAGRFIDPGELAPAAARIAGKVWL